MKFGLGKITEEIGLEVGDEVPEQAAGLMAYMGDSLAGVQEFLALAELEKSGEEYAVCRDVEHKSLDQNFQRIAHLATLKKAIEELIPRLAQELKNHHGEELQRRAEAAVAQAKAGEAAGAEATDEAIAAARSQVSGFGTTRFSGGN